MNSLAMFGLSLGILFVGYIIGAIHMRNRIITMLMKYLEQGKKLSKLVEKNHGK